MSSRQNRWCLNKNYSRLFDVDGMGDFCEAIRVLALIRLDDLAKSEDKLKVEAELILKHKSEFDAIIFGKSIAELEDLEKEIDKILTGDQFTLDIDYWDFLLMMVKRQKSIMTIRNFLEEFRKKSREKKDSKQQNHENQIHIEFNQRPNAGEELEVSIPFDDNRSEICDDELSEEEFNQRLTSERANIINIYLENFIADVTEENISDKERALKYSEHILALMNSETYSKPVNFNEATSNSYSSFRAVPGVSRTNDRLQWIDEYKPRKPHYFNRVKLGYEWSKINQAHYTVDNPPPREVVGYKFNIFYPNLLDSTKTPSFKLFPTENPELIVITFSAGPPYEDISFRLVNKQWDMADRKNFKCIFDRGILCLYFDFVKNRYRR